MIIILLCIVVVVAVVVVVDVVDVDKFLWRNRVISIFFYNVRRLWCYLYKFYIFSLLLFNSTIKCIIIHHHIKIDVFSFKKYRIQKEKEVILVCKKREKKIINSPFEKI